MYNIWTDKRWIFRPSNGLLRVRRNEDLVSFVLCLTVIFIGSMLLWQAFEEYSRAKLMTRWPTSLGRVIESHLEPVAEGGDTRWRPMVRYMYDVKGQTVISAGISPATARDAYGESDAREMVVAYPPNTSVVVFYNPERITDSVLDHALPRFAWLSLFAGLGLVSAGAARLLVSHRVFWR
ncbi:MAG: DUF3592 domain-containing protein [Burkholderiales bacterium]|nr:DUF3592 domain-containing protein [Burkholderiales bacterium]